jgi:hypothetical protein
VAIPFFLLTAYYYTLELVRAGDTARGRGLVGNFWADPAAPHLLMGGGRVEEYAIMDTTTERKLNQTARETTERVQANASKAAEGLRDYQIAMLSATQANINAMFEYMQEAFSARSAPELMQICSKHAHRQMEMMSEQAREISGAVQKATIDVTRSVTGR